MKDSLTYLIFQTLPVQFGVLQVRETKSIWNYLVLAGKNSPFFFLDFYNLLVIFFPFLQICTIMFSFRYLDLVTEQYHRRIQGLVWAYRFSRSKSRKEAGSLGTWVTGTRPPGKSFMFTFRESFKHARMLLGFTALSLKMIGEHHSQ